jgi:hypothetical protein
LKISKQYLVIHFSIVQIWTLVTSTLEIRARINNDSISLWLAFYLLRHATK